MELSVWVTKHDLGFFDSLHAWKIEKKGQKKERYEKLCLRPPIAKDVSDLKWLLLWLAVGRDIYCNAT